jgi:8-oxo-dGTP diphosphatase
MSEISAKGIVIHDGAILVLYRNKRGEEYHTFPGGHIEAGETNEEAAIREVSEETSVTVVPQKLLYRVAYGNESEQLYYFCEYIRGEPKLRDDSEEKVATDQGYSIYKPFWLPLSELPNVVLYPTEVRDALLQGLKTGFSDGVQEFLITHHSVKKKDQ